MSKKVNRKLHELERRHVEALEEIEDMKKSSVHWECTQTILTCSFKGITLWTMSYCVC